MGVKTIYESFSEDTFAKLEEVKGNRTWKEAIKEQFGVKEKEGEKS